MFMMGKYSKRIKSTSEGKSGNESGDSKARVIFLMSNMIRPLYPIATKAGSFYFGVWPDAHP